MMALVLLACYHNSLRVHSYLLRAALIPPSLSPRRKLYDDGDSSSFLHVTGLSRERPSTLFSILWFRLVTACANNAGGGHGCSHRTGCWAFCFVIWVARWALGGFVWFFGITPSPCPRILKKSLYDCEEVAFSSACKHTDSKWTENATICRDDKYPRTNDNKRHRLHGGIGIGNGVHWQKNSAECILLQISVWHHDQQCISFWPWWESIFLCY